MCVIVKRKNWHSANVNTMMNLLPFVSTHSNANVDDILYSFEIWMRSKNIDYYLKNNIYYLCKDEHPVLCVEIRNLQDEWTYYTTLRHILTFKRARIEIISIFNDELPEKIEIIKNKVEYKFCNTFRSLGARKCILEDISINEAKTFIETNHISSDGYSILTDDLLAVGVKHNNELVGCQVYSLLENTIHLHMYATVKYSIPGLFFKNIKYILSKYPAAEYLTCGMRVAHSQNPFYLKYFPFKKYSKHLWFTDGVNRYDITGNYIIEKMASSMNIETIAKKLKMRVVYGYGYYELQQKADVFR